MAYLFDTDAVSELFKPRPIARYLAWLSSVSREDQFTSAVVVGELFAGATRLRAPARHLRNLRDRVLPVLGVIPYDVVAAEAYGRIRAELEDAGTPLADADMQIAATAVARRLVLVTGNVRHFERVKGLTLEPVLAHARAQ